MNETRVALLIRIQPSLKAKLIELAKREHRSLNQQIEFLLEGSLTGEKKVGAKEAEHVPKTPAKRHRSNLEER
jgi:hypothetical protein